MAFGKTRDHLAGILGCDACKGSGLDDGGVQGDGGGWKPRQT